jgi:hypothetical protein
MPLTYFEFGCLGCLVLYGGGQGRGGDFRNRFGRSAGRLQRCGC